MPWRIYNTQHSWRIPQLLNLNAIPKGDIIYLGQDPKDASYTIIVDFPTKLADPGQDAKYGDAREDYIP
jgi:hypothetical protein